MAVVEENEIPKHATKLVWGGRNGIAKPDGGKGITRSRGRSEHLGTDQ